MARFRHGRPKFDIFSISRKTLLWFPLRTNRSRIIRALGGLSSGLDIPLQAHVRKLTFLQTGGTKSPRLRQMPAPKAPNSARKLVLRSNKTKRSTSCQRSSQHRNRPRPPREANSSAAGAKSRASSSPTGRASDTALSGPPQGVHPARMGPSPGQRCRTRRQARATRLIRG